MTIRLATQADYDTVAHITHTTIHAVYPHYYPQGAVNFFLAHHSEERIMADIAANSVYLLEAEGKLPGTLTVKENEICRLFVLPDQQGKGYGRALLDFAEQLITAHHASIILDASLPAKAIYLKRGYRYVESHVIAAENGDFLCYDVLEK